MRLSPFPKAGREMCKDVGHGKEVFPVSGYCLSGSAFLSTEIWNLIQEQQHKHCLCLKE